MQDYDLEQVSSVSYPSNCPSFQTQPSKMQLLGQFLSSAHPPKGKENTSETHVIAEDTASSRLPKSVHEFHSLDLVVAEPLGYGCGDNTSRTELEILLWCRRWSIKGGSFGAII
jgi:hypothetical protein